MTQKNRRSLRVADLIKNELGWLIEKYLKDIYSVLITITKVKLSSDLRLATVYFSVLNNEDKKENFEHILKKAGISLYSISNHKERLEVIKKNSSQFKDPIKLALKYEIMINYDYRRKVAYKGENGNKFLTVKEFADICQEELK